MADISKITLPSGNTYDIKDATARESIKNLTGYTKFLGVTTTELTDGATTNPITVNNESVTATSGAIATYGSKEFIWNGTAWQEFGDMSSIGALGRKDSASGSYTPKGTVSKPTFTGTSGSVSVSGTPKGSVTQPTFTGMKVTATPTFTGSSTTSTGSFTPSGDVDVTPTTTTVYSITGVGTAPSWSASVSNETLSFSFSAGSVPTRASKTVMTGASASFTGTAGDVSVSGTPKGSVKVAYVVGDQDAVAGDDYFTCAGTVSKPTFTGSSTTSTGSFTPSGSVSQPTFTGTSDTITVS